MITEIKFAVWRFLKDKKGIEAMPIKYVIIMLVAAVMLGIIAYILVTLRSGSQYAVTEINKTMTEKINESLSQL